MQSSLSKARIAALVFVFLWFAGGGVAHFIITDFFASIVPPYVPYPYAMVYISGVSELLGAAGLLFAATRQWAGYGLILLVLAVSPANIHMWLHPEQFTEMPEWFLSLRLLIQVLLLGCIWWATRRVPLRSV